MPNSEDQPNGPPNQPESEEQISQITGMVLVDPKDRISLTSHEIYPRGTQFEVSGGESLCLRFVVAIDPDGAPKVARDHWTKITGTDTHLEFEGSTTVKYAIAPAKLEDSVMHYHTIGAVPGIADSKSSQADLCGFVYKGSPLGEMLLAAGEHIDAATTHTKRIEILDQLDHWLKENHGIADHNKRVVYVGPLVHRELRRVFHPMVRHELYPPTDALPAYETDCRLVALAGLHHGQQHQQVDIAIAARDERGIVRFHNIMRHDADLRTGKKRKGEPALLPEELAQVLGAMEQAPIIYGFAPTNDLIAFTQYTGFSYLLSILNHEQHGRALRLPDISGTKAAYEQAGYDFTAALPSEAIDTLMACFYHSPSRRY